MKLLLATIIMPLALLTTVGCSKDTPTFSVIPEENTFVESKGEKSNTKIDILWVIDNSGSMGTSQTNLEDNFQTSRNSLAGGANPEIL